MHPPVSITTSQYERLMKRLECMEEKIDKILSKKDKLRDYGKKPECLPLQTKEEVDQFENSSDEEYANVVDYFTCVGGCDLKEALNPSFRDAVANSLLPLYTWFGTDSRQPLYPTKILWALLIH